MFLSVFLESRPTNDQRQRCLYFWKVSIIIIANIKTGFVSKSLKSDAIKRVVPGGHCPSECEKSQFTSVGVNSKPSCVTQTFIVYNLNTIKSSEVRHVQSSGVETTSVAGLYHSEVKLYIFWLVIAAEQDRE